jgi:hypothetical protein
MPAVPWEHHQALLATGRCGWCAEALAPALVLRGGVCPSCARVIHTSNERDAAAVIARVRGQWGRWRWPVYACVGLGVGLASFVPLGAPVAYALAMVLTHLFVVRRPIRWLGVGRRLATRLTLKLALALLTLVHLVVSVTVYPFVGVGQAVVGVVACLSAVVYVEGSLWLVGNRLAREGVSGSLDRWEWCLPAGLIGGLFGGTALMVGAATLLVHTLLWADIPGVSDLAALLLGVGER